MLDSEVPWKPDVWSLKILSVQQLKKPRFWSQISKSKLGCDTYQLFIFEKIIELFSVASFLKSYELCRIAKEINELINDK